MSRLEWMAVYFLRFARHLFFRNRLPATGFQKLSARLRGHGLTTNSPTEHLQTVQDVSAEDTLIANKVRLQAAGILLSIQVDPDTEVQGWRGTARHASHPTSPALSNGAVESLTVCPRQRGGVRSRVGDDSMQGQSRRAAHRPDLKSEER